MKKKYNLTKTLLIICFLSFQTFVMGQRDVYLVIGQSNTAGRGLIEAEDMVTLSGVDLFNGTSWESAVNTNDLDGDGDVLGGMNRYSTVLNPNQDQGLNFSYTFGRTVNEVTNTQIGLVVNAIGGSNITEWAKGTGGAGYYEAAISQVNLALAISGSNLKGILWHQGEANRNNSATNYLTKLNTLITNLRTDLSAPNLPFIVGQISEQRIDNLSFNTYIKTIADPNSADYIANTDFVESHGLVTSDRTHFISNAQRVLGYRYAARVLKNIYGYTYVENQTILINEDAYVRGGTHADIVQQTVEPDIIRVKTASANNTRNGLVKFDISNITGTLQRIIIDASIIVNANVDVNTTDNAIDVKLYDLDPTSWTENMVTFNTAPPFVNEVVSSASKFYIEDDFKTGIDITEYIKDKYTAGTTTISLGLESDTTDDNAQFKFESKEAASFVPYIVYSYLDVSSTLSNTDFAESDESSKVTFINPVSNNLNITSSFNMDEVSIYTITGIQIDTKKVNQSSTSINVSNLSSGTYIVVVKSNEIKTTKLMVKK